MTEKKYGQLVQLNEEHFGALNTAFAQDGVFIHVAKNVIVEKPLLVIHLYNNAEQFTQSRNLIIAETGAQLNIIEDFQNLSSSAFYNHVTEVYVHENANVNITKLQTETINTTAVHTLKQNCFAMHNYLHYHFFRRSTYSKQYQCAIEGRKIRKLI